MSLCYDGSKTHATPTVTARACRDDVVTGVTAVRIRVSVDFKSGSRTLAAPMASKRATVPERGQQPRTPDPPVVRVAPVVDAV